MIKAHARRKYRVLLAFVPVLAALCLNLKNNSSVKEAFTQPVYDTDKFSINIPAGWRHHTEMSNGFKIFFLNAPPSAGFSPNLNILTEHMQGLTTAQYLRISKENMIKQNFVFDAEGDFQANGITGSYFSTTLDYQGRKLSLKTFNFFKSGLAYIITGTCLGSQAGAYRPIFDKTVMSFKVK